MRAGLSVLRLERSDTATSAAVARSSGRHAFCIVSGAMVRIMSELRGDKTVVRIAGRLLAADVPVLIEASGGVQGEIELDLTELRDVDEGGVSAIQALCEQGAAVIGASPYVKLRLQSVKKERG